MDIKTSQDKKFDALEFHSARLKETVLNFSMVLVQNIPSNC